MATKGLFITLEGGEGVGKTTQQSMLVRRVRGLGREVVTTREPGGTNLGRTLRRILEADAKAPEPMAELMLFMADRAQHVGEVIGPALAAGQVVICDRFADSSEVYQGVVRGVGQRWVRNIHRAICGEAWPDLTILLDLDPVRGLDRVACRQGELGLGLTPMEKEDLEFHRKVRQGFLDQAEREPDRIKVLPAGDPAHEVAEAVWALVEPLLKEG